MSTVAYLILAHGLPYQTIDLLWSVWRQEDSYFVHIDRKSPPAAEAAIAAIARSFPNVHVVPSEVCGWGGFSLVDAAHRCIASALTSDSSWSHAALISGTHVPLRRAAALADSLEPGFSYLTFHDFDLAAATLQPPNFWSGIARRITVEHQEIPGLGYMRGPTRLPPEGVTYFWGSQWWILSRPAAEFVWGSRNGALANYFRGTYIPDETYIQTLLANSHLKTDLRLRQILWQKWEEGRPTLLSAEDLAVALTSKQFFARKACEATMQDETGILQRAVASISRESWLRSVTTAFADYLPPSLAPVVTAGYLNRGKVREQGLTESRVRARSFLKRISIRMREVAAELGFSLRISTTIPAINQAILLCEFPNTEAHACYFLILRTCNLEIGWLGIYIKSADREKALADIQDLSTKEVFDSDFPAAAGLVSYSQVLRFDLRKKGVMRLGSVLENENIATIASEYLGILSKIHGMVR